MWIEPGLYFAYIAACIAIIAVPGPNVTVIIANSLRYGTRAGLASVAGTQVGLAVMLLVLGFGLEQIAEHLAVVFEIVRWLGAAYLVWLGVRLWRSNGDLVAGEAVRPARGFFWQGFVVLLSNPKVLLFFGAFIPQFVNPAGDAFAQTIVLGVTFMVVATVLDAAYALAAGSAGSWLTTTRVRLVERLSGSFLIAGGLWLALTRRA